MIITKRNLIENNLYPYNILINRKNKIVRSYEYQEIIRLTSSLVFNFKKRITIFNNKLLEFNQWFSKFKIVVKDFLVKITTYLILVLFTIIITLGFILFMLISYIIFFILLGCLIDCFASTALFIHRELQKVLSKVKDLLRYLFYSQSEELETLRMSNRRLVAGMSRIRSENNQLTARYNQILFAYQELIMGRLTRQVSQYERHMRVYFNRIIYRLAQLEQVSQRIELTW